MSRRRIVSCIDRTQRLIHGSDGWSTVFLENHDQARSVSRFADDSPRFRGRSAKLLALMQTCLSGTLFLYQGQEIGCVNAPKDSYPVERYLDIESRLFVKMVEDRYGASNKAAFDKAFSALQHLARDHARIPMAWNGNAEYAGFSDAAETQMIQEPWMKQHPLAGEINVASQVDEPDSVLGFWRKMSRFRLEYMDLLVYGDFIDLSPQDEDIFLFIKKLENAEAKVLVVLNFTTKQKAWEMPRPVELRVPEGHLKAVLVMSTHRRPSDDYILAPLEGRVYIVTT